MKYCLTSLLLCCALVRAYSQGTAFSYQGRLTDGANPVNGLYDLRFTLFDAAGGGNAVGVLTNTATSVSNSLFTAVLQFGSGTFTGADRWLEIAVRTNGGGAFTPLAPRQPMLATPYALAAREVTGLVAAERLSGLIPPANIGAETITSVMLAPGSVHSNHLAAGSVHSNALVVGSIHSNHLAVGSVHSNALALGSVTAFALASGSIHSNHLAAGSVHSNALAFGSVHSNALAFGSVTAAALAAGSVHSNALVIGSIHSNHLAVGSVSLESLGTSVSGSFSTTINSPSAGFIVFGGALAVVGTDTVIVGANQDSNAGDNVGAAYLMNTSGALVRTFISPAPQNQARFGIVVAAVGQDKVLIGSDQQDAAALDIGTAYLFGTNGTLITTFTNPTPAASDLFGCAVAAVGADKVLIGAYGDHFGANLGGAAYLFTTNRTLLTTFTNPTPASGDRFGIAVAAVGTDKVLIGADSDDWSASNAGVAYLFHTNGTLLTTFTNPTPVTNDNFGFAVAAVGPNAVLIGAPGDNSAGNAGGAAYLFNTSGALLATFSNPTPASGDQFGAALAAVAGDKVVIGAQSDDAGANNAGAAYLFSIDGTLLSTFNNPVPANGDLFGSAVAALGTDKVLVGASADDGGFADAGAVHLFTLNAYLPGLTLDPSFGTWQKTGASAYFNGGNVGIGTLAPQTPLHVVGASSQLRLQDSLLGNYWNIYTENHPSAPDGNLLFVSGPTGAFGFIRKSDGVYFSSSDARLKQDVRGLPDVLERVLRLRPVSYRFKSASDAAHPTLGLVAQEVEPLFPEVVGEHDGMKAIGYAELVPVTVRAIQELNQKLTEELKRRDAENAELKRNVDELKAMVNALARKLNGDARGRAAASLP